MLMRHLISQSLFRTTSCFKEFGSLESIVGILDHEVILSLLDPFRKTLQMLSLGLNGEGNFEGTLFGGGLGPILGDICHGSASGLTYGYTDDKD